MQFVIARHEDGVSNRIECPICGQHMTITHEPHHVSVKATHHNATCPWGGETFRVHPDSGYAEKVAP